LGITTKISIRVGGQTTSLSYYQNLSKDFTDSLKIITEIMVTLQSQTIWQLSLFKRELDLLTAEKDGLCLFYPRGRVLFLCKSVDLSQTAKN
jgi:hypothetical protein